MGMLCARAGISLTNELASARVNKVRVRKTRGQWIIEFIFADWGTILSVLTVEGCDEVTAWIQLNGS
jgi:hypothetical protein